jgi:hypothetical protein
MARLEAARGGPPQRLRVDQADAAGAGAGGAGFSQHGAREAGDDNARRVEHAYRLTLSRLPSEAERRAVYEFLTAQQAQIGADSRGAIAGDDARRQALAALCLVLLNTNEFAYAQ